MIKMGLVTKGYLPNNLRRVGHIQRTPTQETISKKRGKVSNKYG